MTATPSTVLSTGSPEARCNLCTATFARASAEVLVKDGHTIVRCPTCGLLFRVDAPDARGADDIYGTRTSAPRRRRSRHARGVLGLRRDDAECTARTHGDGCGDLPQFAEPGALLDVGCAAGFFVDEASRPAGGRAGSTSPNAMVEWGRRHACGRHQRRDAATIAAGSHRACVTMWDYIEHALDPRRDVEHAFARLRPAASSRCRPGTPVGARTLSLERWHLMTPGHHNYFFTGATISRCWRSVGFDVLYLAILRRSSRSGTSPTRPASRWTSILTRSPAHSRGRRSEPGRVPSTSGT